MDLKEREKFLCHKISRWLLDVAEGHYEPDEQTAEGILREIQQANALSSGTPGVSEPITLDAFDAGLLNDYGGGNVAWWFNSIREHLADAHAFYQEQVNNAWPPAALAQGAVVTPAKCPCGLPSGHAGEHRHGNWAAAPPAIAEPAGTDVEDYVEVWFEDVPEQGSNRATIRRLGIGRKLAAGRKEGGR
jgi:hypothetical protein